MRFEISGSEISSERDAYTGERTADRVAGVLIHLIWLGSPTEALARCTGLPARR